MVWRRSGITAMPEPERAPRSRRSTEPSRKGRPSKCRAVCYKTQQGGHMKLLTVALLGLTLAACGSPPTWTLWQVNTSVGTVTDIKELETGLERTACELAKQGHVKSAQAITSGNGLLVNHTADGAV